MPGEMFDDGYDLNKVINRGGRRVKKLEIGPNARKEIAESLRQLLSRLKRFFNINRAVLAFFDPAAGNLRVTHIYRNNDLNTSLTLVIPGRESIMQQVLEQGFPVAENYPDQLTCNIIERKIILSEETKTVLLAPLSVNAFRVGVLVLSSPDDYAFGIYFDGVGSGMVEDFAKTAEDILRREAAYV